MAVQSKLLTLGKMMVLGPENAGVTTMIIGNECKVTTVKRPTNLWDSQVYWTVAEGVKKGDVLLASFTIRCERGQVETGEGRTVFLCERGADPWTKSIEHEVAIPKKATRIDIPFVAVEDLEPGQMKVNFRLGFGAQIFYFSNFTLKNYGTTTRINALPRTRTTYRGSEPAAAWRAKAQARIETLRKSTLAVRVLGKNGKPLPNAAVQLTQTRRAFPIGSAVDAKMLLTPGSDGDKYRAFVEKHCTRVVLENDLKWQGWEGDGKHDAPKAIAWLRERKITVRGHNLVWPSWGNLPDDLQALKNNKTALAKRIDDHIIDEVSAMRGQLIDWDVVNETFDNHDLMDTLGSGALKHWYELARKHDPKARLFLNDYPPLDGSDTKNPHLEHFYATLSALKQSNAPLGGIGFQCHFGSTPIDPERLLSGLDRFGKLGLPIAITEFDINTNDETLQAAYTSDFLTAIFSHPAADSIVMWGFWEGRHWLPDAALYRKDWTLKPNGKAYLDLLNSWTTTASGRTKASGLYETRGFHGEYTVSVTVGAQTIKTNITLGKANQIVTVRV
jgi:endo-1,4-beta-xylanase